MDKKILKMEDYSEPTSAEERQLVDDLKRIISTPIQDHDPFAAFRQLIAMDLASEEQYSDSSKPCRRSKGRRLS